MRKTRRKKVFGQSILADDLLALRRLIVKRHNRFGSSRCRGSCPFRNRNFSLVTESVAIKKKENHKPEEPRPFVSLTVFLTTTPPQRPAKIPKNLST